MFYIFSFLFRTYSSRVEPVAVPEEAVPEELMAPTVPHVSVHDTEPPLGGHFSLRNNFPNSNH